MMILVEGCQIPCFQHLGAPQFPSLLSAYNRFFFFLLLFWLAFIFNIQMESHWQTRSVFGSESCTSLSLFQAFPAEDPLIFKKTGRNMSRNGETQDTQTSRTDWKTFTLHCVNLRTPGKNNSCMLLIKPTVSLLLPRGKTAAVLQNCSLVFWCSAASFWLVELKVRSWSFVILSVLTFTL